MNMQQMMRQAQKMQKELQKAQQEIAEMTFEGTAGGGMVTAVARGDKSIESLPSTLMWLIPKMLKCFRIWFARQSMRRFAALIKWAVPA